MLLVQMNERDYGAFTFGFKFLLMLDKWEGHAQWGVIELNTTDKRVLLMILTLLSLGECFGLCPRLRTPETQLPSFLSYLVVVVLGGGLSTDLLVLVMVAIIGWTLMVDVESADPDDTPQKPKAADAVEVADALVDDVEQEEVDAIDDDNEAKVEEVVDVVEEEVKAEEVEDEVEKKEDHLIPRTHDEEQRMLELAMKRSMALMNHVDEKPINRRRMKKRAGRRVRKTRRTRRTDRRGQDVRDVQTFGLRNAGNTCYINSVVQCLFATKPFVTEIMQGHGGELEASLRETFEKLTQRSFEPTRLLGTVMRMNRKFQIGEVGDSAEFLTFLLDNIGSELFVEKVSSILACQRCYTEVMTVNDENLIQLPIHKMSSLDACLKAFTKIEDLEGYRCRGCGRTSVQKRLKFENCPQILALQMIRFVFESIVVDV